METTRRKRSMGRQRRRGRANGTTIQGYRPVEIKSVDPTHRGSLTLTFSPRPISSVREHFVSESGEHRDILDRRGEFTNRRPSHRSLFFVSDIFSRRNATIFHEQQKPEKPPTNGSRSGNEGCFRCRRRPGSLPLRCSAGLSGEGEPSPLPATVGSLFSC